jgi:hypothetical protein
MNKVLAALAVVSVLSCGAAFANEAKGGTCVKKHGGHCRSAKKALKHASAVAPAATKAAK